MTQEHECKCEGRCREASLPRLRNVLIVCAVTLFILGLVLHIAAYGEMPIGLWIVFSIFFIVFFAVSFFFIEFLYSGCCNIIGSYQREEEKNRKLIIDCTNAQIKIEELETNLRVSLQDVHLAKPL